MIAKALSFQQMYESVQNAVQDWDADALTFIKQEINTGQGILETELGSYYTEETINRTSTANNGTYDNPVNMVTPVQIYVVVSGLKYDLEMVYDEDYFQFLKSSYYNQYSDSPTHVIFRRDTFEIFPGLKTAGSTITLRYNAGGVLLQYDDYTTGTITTLTNGDDDVTGSGPTWTVAMEGRYFKINADGHWYKIEDVSSTTALQLDRFYQGASIAAGTSTYTIGQLPETPADTHHIPGLYAKWQYFEGYKQNADKGLIAQRQFEKAIEKATTTHSKRTTSSYIPGNRGRRTVYNPNYPPRNLS